MNLILKRTLPTILSCCIFTVVYAQNSTLNYTDCECGISNVKSPRGRVFGGQFAGINEFPWQVGLYYTETNELFCGASIISTLYLLSAARCFFVFNWTSGEYWEVNAGAVMGIMGSRFRLPSGAMTPDEANEFRQIQLAYVLRHPKYYPSLPHNDIALIQCSDPITRFNEAVSPICLPFEETQSGSEVYVTGWGQFVLGSNLPIALRIISLAILPWNNCIVQNLPPFFDPTTMGCAYYPEQTACNGDFGGPVVYRNPKYNVFVQVGIISYAWPCTFADADYYPLFYTDVFNYIKWLEEIVKEDLCLLE